MAKSRIRKTQLTQEPRLADEDTVKLAEKIRGQYHEDIGEALIAYVFIPKGQKKAGRVTLGSAKKESAVARLVSGVDFIIRLAEDQWVEMTVKQRTAWLDHLLSHCAAKVGKDGVRTGWQKRGHDIEEFLTVIQRHGLLFQQQQEFADALKQLSLFDDVKAAAS